MGNTTKNTKFLKMKKIYLIFIVLFMFSCKTSKRIEVKVNYFKRDICQNYCNYVKFEIINNSNKDYYLPQGYKVEFLDINNKNISIAIDSLDFGYYNDYFQFFNFNNGKPNLEEDGIIYSVELNNQRALRETKLYKANIKKLTENNYKQFILPHLKNEIVNSKRLKIEQDEFMSLKFGDIIFLEKKSSITIIRDITSIFKSTKFDKIKVLYKYKALSLVEDVGKTDYFLYSLSYFENKNKIKIKINNKYPKKILGKYHLISELKSKDTLTINIK